MGKNRHLVGSVLDLVRALSKLGHAVDHVVATGELDGPAIAQLVHRRELGDDAILLGVVHVLQAVAQQLVALAGDGVFEDGQRSRQLLRVIRQVGAEGIHIGEVRRGMGCAGGAKLGHDVALNVTPVSVHVNGLEHVLLRLLGKGAPAAVRQEHLAHGHLLAQGILVHGDELGVDQAGFHEAADLGQRQLVGRIGAGPDRLVVLDHQGVGLGHAIGGEEHVQGAGAALQLAAADGIGVVHAVAVEVSVAHLHAQVVQLVERGRVLGAQLLHPVFADEVVHVVDLAAARDAVDAAVDGQARPVGLREGRNHRGNLVEVRREIQHRIGLMVHRQVVQVADAEHVGDVIVHHAGH